MQEGEFKANPFGKLCVTVPVILAAIYAVIRVMLYCAWLSDHAIEVTARLSRIRKHLGYCFLYELACFFVSPPALGTP